MRMVGKKGLTPLFGPSNTKKARYRHNFIFPRKDIHDFINGTCGVCIYMKYQLIKLLERHFNDKGTRAENDDSELGKVTLSHTNQSFSWAGFQQRWKKTHHKATLLEIYFYMYSTSTVNHTIRNKRRKKALDIKISSHYHKI